MVPITNADLDWWFNLEAELDWRFATTYAQSAPHEYVLAGKTPGLTSSDLIRAAHVIRTFGEPMKFFNTTRIYLTTPMGWKHWDMQGGLIEDSTVTLINRGRVEHVYGVQNAPRTLSGVESAYDGLATTWDAQHGMTDEEKAQTSDFIRGVFGDKLGRTLDVGCGTGWPLDVGIVDSVRYVGIDSSTGMLNSLVAKHPHLAGIHPMTFSDAIEGRALCGVKYDTVLSLGGSASYLGEEGIDAMRRVALRNMLVMTYGPGHSPATDDIDTETLSTSLATATDHAATIRHIGRFTAFVIE